MSGWTVEDGWEKGRMEGWMGGQTNNRNIPRLEAFAVTGNVLS